MISLLAATVPSTLEFNTCEVPEFEWAVYGNRVTGRMYAMTAAVTGQFLFAGGFLKSTLNPEDEGFVESDADYAITGPFTSVDPDGSNGNTVTVDLKSYPTSGGATENAGGSFRGYEVGIAKIDLTTGQPVRRRSHFFRGCAAAARSGRLATAAAMPPPPPRAAHAPPRPDARRSTSSSTTARRWTRAAAWRRRATPSRFRATSRATFPLR